MHYEESFYPVLLRHAINKMSVRQLGKNFHPKLYELSELNLTKLDLKCVIILLLLPYT